MLSKFENIPLFEAVLLILGVIAFLVLLFLLVWNVIKQRPFKSFLLFFLIPILMIGYPTIQTIQFQDLLIILKQNEELVSENPNNVAARENLKEVIANIKSGNRFANSENALLAVSNAEITLGNYDAASVYLQKAEKVAPKSNRLNELRARLDNKLTQQNTFSKNIQTLKEQMGQLKQSQDTLTLQKMAQTLSTLNVPVYVQPEEMVTLAKSYAITGNKKQSIEIINTLDPSESSLHLNIKSVKDSIDKDLYQKKFLKPNIQPKSILMSVPINMEKLNNVVIKKTNDKHE